MSPTPSHSRVAARDSRRGATASDPESRPAATVHERISAFRSRRAITIFLLAFVLLLAGDLFFKAWAFSQFELNDPPHTVIPSILALKLTLNEGAIFGMMQGQKIVFVIASLLAIGIIAYYFGQSDRRERIVHISLALIFAGAMGNLFDRIAYGAVRDMLYLFPEVPLPFGWRWANGSGELYPWIFNLADVYLLFGIVIILIRSLFFQPAEKQQPKAQGANAESRK